jgi:uncharacterized protein (DUF2141 family)
MKALIICFLSYFLIAPPMQKLTIEVTNIKQAKGTLNVAIYDEKSSFPDEKSPTFFRIIPIQNTENLKFTIEVPKGQYAVAIFQDLNNNKKLDKNIVGFPKEPYGFSNNFRPKFAAPKFEDCAFDVGGSTQTVSIKIGN